jgi:hypothetical protein
MPSRRRSSGLGGLLLNLAQLFSDDLGVRRIWQGIEISVQQFGGLLELPLFGENQP